MKLIRNCKYGKQLERKLRVHVGHEFEMAIRHPGRSCGVVSSRDQKRGLCWKCEHGTIDVELAFKVLRDSKMAARGRKQKASLL
jgi:hypothetical protein